MEYEVCPTLLHMASSGYQPPELLILSPISYPLGHALPRALTIYVITKTHLKLQKVHAKPLQILTCKYGCNSCLFFPGNHSTAQSSDTPKSKRKCSSQLPTGKMVIHRYILLLLSTMTWTISMPKSEVGQ